MSRPAGVLGTVWHGMVHHSEWPGDEPYTTGLTYHAVNAEDGTWLWRDGQWVYSPGYATHFTPRPDFQEWQGNCPHEGAMPWLPCDTAAQCDALAREEHRIWGDR